MSLALEVIGLQKRFTAGVGSCLATNAVLRGIDVEIERGEVAAIVGAPGSGRSTLLLCIAGLLAADRGILRRFGDESREAGARLTRHYLSCDDLWCCAESSGPALHLLDLSDFSALQLTRLRGWLGTQSQRGDAALVVADSVELARHLTRRTLVLREGLLAESPRAHSRVAERHFVDRPFERV